MFYESTAILVRLLFWTIFWITYIGCCCAQRYFAFVPPTPHSLPSSSLLPSIALHFYHKMQLSPIPISCTSEILGLILIMLCPTTKKELGLNVNK